MKHSGSTAKEWNHLRAATPAQGLQYVQQTVPGTPEVGLPNVPWKSHRDTEAQSKKEYQQEK